MENNGLSFDQPLGSDEQRNLRSRGVIQESEVAVRVGDLLVAVNSLTGSRRQVSSEGLVAEGRRQILKD
jgi:hypothetical protein